MPKLFQSHHLNFRVSHPDLLNGGGGGGGGGVIIIN